MKFEEVLPRMRIGEIVFHGMYAHKIEDGKFYVDTPLSIKPWMEIDVDCEMLMCNNWNFIGGSDWQKWI